VIQKNQVIDLSQYVYTDGLGPTSLLFDVQEVCYDPDDCNLLPFVCCDHKVIPNPEPLKCVSGYQGKCPFF